MAQCGRGRGTLRLGCWDRRPGRPGKGRASTTVVATREGHAAHLGSLCGAVPPTRVGLYIMGFPGGSVSKESACKAGNLGSVPGSARPPGAGNGNPLQYSCLENSTDRGAWWALVHGVAKSQT